MPSEILLAESITALKGHPATLSTWQVSLWPSRYSKEQMLVRMG